MKIVLKTFAAALLFGVAAMGVAKADPVKIGVAAEPYPPFTSPDASGKWVGWEIEFIDAVCAEEIADIASTVEHVKLSNPDIFFTTVSYPIKGTPYFDKVATRLVNVRPWRESTDREFRIAGRHSRRFYQYADELLRSEMAEQHDAVQIDANREKIMEAVVGDGNAIGGVEENSGGEILERVSVGEGADDDISVDHRGLNAKTVARIGGCWTSAGKIIAMDQDVPPHAL